METDPKQELADLVFATRLHAERESRRGRQRIPGPSPTPPPVAIVSAPAATVAVRAPAVPAPVSAPTPAPAKHVASPGQDATQPADVAPGIQNLEDLRRAVSECQACGLCETRQQTVFADGSGTSRVLFVGEAPGADEDASGVPFVGRAGQLLTDIITKGMKLRREDVYIANVLKCRPPGNRDPEPKEKALCTPWLDRQIELLNPQVIIPLGKHASQHMLGTQDSMGRMRGRVHEVRGQKIVPTYHPAFLLRSPHMKKDCWQDIKLALDVLGLS
jgi:uracil-DNA glycosylase